MHDQKQGSAAISQAAKTYNKACSLYSATFHASTFSSVNVAVGSGKAAAAPTSVERMWLQRPSVLLVLPEGVRACTLQVAAYEKGVMHETPSVASLENASPLGTSWLRKALMVVLGHP